MKYIHIHLSCSWKLFNIWLINAEADGEQSVNESANNWKGFFSISSYTQYFNVDTDIVLNRILSSFYPSSGDFFSKIEQQPIAWISERSAYGQLAMQGLSIFDKQQKIYQTIQKQWQPLLNTIIDNQTAWF